MTERLSLVHIGLTSPQFLDRIFLLGDVQRIADQSRDFAILEHWLAGAMHRSLAIFRMVDAILDIAVHTFRKHFPDQVSQHSPVVWVKNVEPLTEGRDALIWIEAENRKGFRRPIVKHSVRLERPTSHVSEPFSFAQIKLVPLQLRR